MGIGALADNSQLIAGGCCTKHGSPRWPTTLVVWALSPQVLLALADGAFEGFAILPTWISLSDGALDSTRSTVGGEGVLGKKGRKVTSEFVAMSFLFEVELAVLSWRFAYETSVPLAGHHVVLVQSLSQVVGVVSAATWECGICRLHIGIRGTIVGLGAAAELFVEVASADVALFFVVFGCAGRGPTACQKVQAGHAGTTSQPTGNGGMLRCPTSRKGWEEHCLLDWGVGFHAEVYVIDPRGFMQVTHSANAFDQDIELVSILRHLSVEVHENAIPLICVEAQRTKEKPGHALEVDAKSASSLSSVPDDFEAGKVGINVFTVFAVEVHEIEHCLSGCFRVKWCISGGELSNKKHKSRYRLSLVVVRAIL